MTKQKAILLLQETQKELKKRLEEEGHTTTWYNSYSGQLNGIEYALKLLK